MVEKNFNIFNFKSQSSCASSPSVLLQSGEKENLENSDNNNISSTGNNNNNDGNKNSKDPKDKYVKILVNDPFNNRDIILKVTKKQKGVYIWESVDGKHMYVGHSINLYNRISSYFMPSILKTKARRVLRYLNKYGFSNMKLTIYIMDEKSSLEQVVALEQHFIDSLKPNLNVDLVASSSFLLILSIILLLLILSFLPLDINFLFEIANRVISISPFDIALTPLVIYSYNDKELAIKENRGKSGVYRWVNTLTGDTYVGSAVSLSKRFSVYYSTKSVKEVLSRSRSKILSALLKYDYSAFRLEILEYCEPSQTIIREQYYLDLLKPEYNILRIASSSLGNILSDETKLKISNSLKGRCLSEEVKEKMSISRTGRIFSVETKNKLSELRKGKPSPFLGKTHSEETRKKMSEGIGSKVEVFNKDTLETKIYPSNIKAAEALACSESTIRYYLKHNKPYKGKYLFKKIDKV